MASTIGSIIGGRPAAGSPASTVSSPNPSRLTDLVGGCVYGGPRRYLRRRVRRGETGAAVVG
jgi:hypothetical protein